MRLVVKVVAGMVLLCLLDAHFAKGGAQGTAFLYQGRLNDGTSPANGSYDLTFTLYETNTEVPMVIAGPVTNAATAVVNGLFTATIDFGTGIFDGSSYWLEIGVRTNGGTDFTTLVPRQPISPTPYAVFAGTAGNLLSTVQASQLTGTIPLELLPAAVVTNNATGVSLDGDFTGSLAASSGFATNIILYGTTNSRAVKIQGGHYPSEYQIGSTNNGNGGNIQDIFLRYSDWRNVVWYRTGVTTNRYHPQSPFVETEIAVTNAANETGNAKAYWQVSVWDRRASGGGHNAVAQWYEYDWNGGSPSGYNFDGKPNVVSINLDDGVNWAGNIVYTMYTYDYLMLYKGIQVSNHRWDDGNGNILATNLVGPVQAPYLVNTGLSPVIRSNATYIARASIIGRGDVMLLSWSNNATPPVSGATVITITNLWNGSLPTTTNTLFVNGVTSASLNSPSGAAAAPNTYWFIADPASPSNSVTVVSASPSANTAYSVCFRVDKIR
ncbi:MAG TPA: hypothetical protein VMB80_09320 [Candidatus Acidoferrum sp.]|nr:hypothetical protein [Candidatus Acidoferrum sp.]